MGNLYSAQIYTAIRKALPEFDSLLKKGDFKPILQWLRTNIHQHGRMYSAQDLMQRATGSKIAVAPFLEYLTAKYGRLYKITN